MTAAQDETVAFAPSELAGALAEAGLLPVSAQFSDPAVQSCLQAGGVAAAWVQTQVQQMCREAWMSGNGSALSKHPAFEGLSQAQRNVARSFARHLVCGMAQAMDSGSKALPLMEPLYASMSVHLSQLQALTAA